MPSTASPKTAWGSVIGLLVALGFAQEQLQVMAWSMAAFIFLYGLLVQFTGWLLTAEHGLKDEWLESFVNILGYVGRMNEAYRELLRRVLDWIDDKLGDGLSPEAKKDQEQASLTCKNLRSYFPFSLESYDFLLRVALVYPLFFMAFSLAFLGEAGLAGGPSLELDTPVQRILFVVAVVFFPVIFSWCLRRVVKARSTRQKLSYIIASTVAFTVAFAFAFAGAFAGAVAVAVAVAFAVAGAVAGVFAVAGAVTGASAGAVVFAFAGVFAVAGAVAGAGAVAFAFAGAFAGAVAVAVTGAVAVAVAGAAAAAVAGAGAVAVAGAAAAAVAFAVAVAILFQTWYERQEHSRKKVFCCIEWAALMGVFLLIAAQNNNIPFLTNLSGIFIPFGVFFLYLPLANVLFDFVSLGLTRGLLRFSLAGPSTGGYAIFRTLVIAIIDFLLALVMMVLLVVALAILFKLLNFATGDKAWLLRTMIEGLGDGDEPANYWIYATIFSTLIPTLLHLILAAIGISLGLLSLFEYFKKKIVDYLSREEGTKERGLQAMPCLIALLALVVLAFVAWSAWMALGAIGVFEDFFGFLIDVAKGVDGLF